ncbi:unnamed protein product [Effrenium voratum]|uniref:Uncharacterized protein n=1 Tax=Effrenium voratum TaxID=2562239 RepID=A0AA36JRA7_9DINO|nr:unnamed protein product [Effrenium voratum]CAJ1461624.1 unnamed protein product [Effrenium voratum]
MTWPTRPLVDFAAAAVTLTTALWLLRYRRRNVLQEQAEAPKQEAPLYVPAPPDPEPEPTVDFDAQLRKESGLLLAASETVQMVLQTGAFKSLPHVHVAEKQLQAISAKLEEVSDLLSPHNMFWRYGRDQPMQQLLDTPLLQLAAAEGVMVPVTLGHISQPGDLLVARFLVSGTDASKSRYREFASGILDALQRDRLMMRLEWIFHSMWDLPLTWGDGIDDFGFGAHGSTWGVSIKPAYG